MGWGPQESEGLREQVARNTEGSSMDVRSSHPGETTALNLNGRISRRTLLRSTLGLAGAALLAACGGSPTATTAPAASSAPSKAPSAAPAASSAPASAAPSSGPASSAPASAAPAGAATAASTRVASPATTGSPAASGSPAAVAGKIPSPLPGVPDAYTAAPAPFKSYNGVPGTGGKVNVFTIAYQS